MSKSASKLPWLIAAIPLLAALHAGCGNNNGNSTGYGDADTDGAFNDGQAGDDANLLDDGPMSDAHTSKG